MELQTLLASLILNTHNIRVLHWNVVGIDFDPVHKILDKYYNTLQQFTDEIAEISLQLNIPTLGMIDAFKVLKDDEKEYISLSGSKFYSSVEVFEQVEKIFSGLIIAYEEACRDENIPSDINNKLEEHIYYLRKELRYKNRSRLGRN
jgi:DNA-binding ferritin-like protein (oxidative damage protectant)